MEREPLHSDLPTPTDEPRSSILGLAFTLEGGLAVAAILIGWLADFSPVALIRLDAGDLFWGAAATIPMLAFLAACSRVRWRPIRRIHVVIDRFLVPMFQGHGLATLVIVALLAGLGEELFFRGLMQAGLARWIGGTAGLVIAITVASLVFGLLHPMTVGYFVSASIMGAYFGLLLWATDNLLTPIVAHTLYDLVALLYYVYWRRGDGHAA